MRQIVIATARILPIFLIVLFGIQCRKNGPSSSTPPPVTEPGRTIIAGVVMDEQYKPLPGVEITAGNLKQFTDGNGVFLIPDVPVSDNRTYIVCKKDGYFNGSKGLKTADGSVTQFNMIMAKKVFLQNFAASSGINATVSNAKVAIPANSIITDNGGAGYSGTVTMSGRHINPDDPNFPSLMPGGDFEAVNSAANRVELLSFGAIEVELEGSSGQRLQLLPGKEATLTFPIAASQLATAPATIPLWEFDEEAGIWREEGIATKQGNAYVGKVKHFSTHNVDKPAPRAFVKGTVRNCEGQPMRGIPVRIGGEEVSTDLNGNYEVTVTALEPMKGTVENFFEAGGTTITKQIQPLTEGERRTVDFTLDCVLTIIGSIAVCGGSEEETAGLVTLKWTGGTSIAVTDQSGKFSIYAPRNKQVALNAYGYEGIKSQEHIFTTPDAGKKEIGKIVVCQKEEQGQVIFTLDGSGHNNETITINDGGSAFVPEAVYYKEDDQTILMKTGMAGYGFQARFDGKTTGKPEFDLALVYAKEINGTMQSFTLVPVPGKVTFTITKYGAVGEKIEGTFSGTFQKFTGSSPVFTEVQVKNGQFSLYRSPDEL
jgi:hypothetical protein